jgi:hypothetical protein
MMPRSGSSADVFRDTRSKLTFGMNRRDLAIAIEQPVEDRANQRRTIQHLSRLLSDLGGDAVKPRDLTIEEDHRDFGPGLVVDHRTSTPRLFPGESRRPCHALRAHGGN